MVSARNESAISMGKYVLVPRLVGTTHGATRRQDAECCLLTLFWRHGKRRKFKNKKKVLSDKKRAVSGDRAGWGWHLSLAWKNGCHFV